jgi:hypothetical protein
MVVVRPVPTGHNGRSIRDGADRMRTEYERCLRTLQTGKSVAHSPVPMYIKPL